MHSGWRWYLVAYDLDRDDWRTFRVDRIAGRTPSRRPRARRREVPGGDPAAYVKQQIRGGEASDAGRGRIRLAAPASLTQRARARAATRPSPPDGPDPASSPPRARWSREFLVWMALMDVEMTVLEPPELVAEAQTIVSRLKPVAA